MNLYEAIYDATKQSVDKSTTEVTDIEYDRAILHVVQHASQFLSERVLCRPVRNQMHLLSFRVEVRK